MGRDRRGDRGRERGGDRYQVGRIDGPLDLAEGTSGATLEELPSVPLPVAQRRGPRLGLGGTLVVIASAGLLAAGFGVLGGRPSPSPSAPLGAVATTMPAPTPGTGQSPLVTPFSQCAAPPTSAPAVQLQVNGRPVAGSVEVLRSGADPSPPLEGLDGATSIPVDVISELWVVGGACAHAWDVGLIAGDTLNRLVNPALDPAIASQNRFGVTLAPYGGRDAVLRADLYFPDLAVRALWRISIQPFERPVASLRVGGSRYDATSIVAGCDVELTLGNGYVFPMDRWCGGAVDLPFEPDIAIRLDRDDHLEFALGDWEVSNAVLACGRLSGTSFIAQPDAGCFIEASGRDTEGTSITFRELPPDLEAGAWTIAISACALSGAMLVTNRICGTWFANVEFGD